jgi:galactose oxidase
MKVPYAASLLLGAVSVGAHKSADYSYESSEENRPEINGQVTGEIQWQSPPVNSTLLNIKPFRVTCTGSKWGHYCEKATDGKSDTYWESDNLGHGPPWISIDLKTVHNISGLTMLPRLDDSLTEGQIANHRVYLSKDERNWGEPVAYGTWGKNKGMKLAAFNPTPARYVKLVGDTPPIPDAPGWHEPASIVNLGIYAADYTLPVEPGKGAWGPTLDLPVIPVGAAQEQNGQIILWSAWADDQFFASPGGKTLTTTWNPKTETIEQTVVAETHHDMFCPGMSMDFNGSIVVSGGGDAGRTSIFNGKTWEYGPDMRQPRGYHATTTLSDGRIFAIGGSWSGGNKEEKNGEVYNPIKRKWYTRSGTKVNNMLTNDRLGRWRADNHAWLFGWKDGSAFQAGPSVKMNWYTVEKSGSTTPAGRRMDDGDSMSGNAVMFDAVHGKILTFGGQPSYDGSYATKNAHIITLATPGEEPLVQIAGKGSGNGMNFPRVYHTSVVLPDGKVFVAGGQAWGQPFNEKTVQFYPEIYNPETDTFELMNGQNIIRVYHSISMLLPDATVLNGGGGLCGNCSANHYDAQIFTPPYLLTATGERRERPKIVSAYERVIVGGELKFSADKHIGSASLVRQGTTTHTVNTDQRRVPLELNAHEDHTFTANLPDDAGILLPGWYMLFAFDAEGTPSEASLVKVELSQYATIELEEMLEGDSDYEDVEDLGAHEECDEEKMSGMLSAILSSPTRVWKSWKPLLVLQGN